MHASHGTGGSRGQRRVGAADRAGLPRRWRGGGGVPGVDPVGLLDRGHPAPRQPEGTVNLTTADRPTLYIELANIITNTVLTQRKAELRVYTEGWNVYEIKEGRGRMLYSN